MIANVGFTMSKIQNWKQFTTRGWQQHPLHLSVLPCQRYKIESNSQPFGCHANFYFVGFTMSKIQNWKQFTTATACHLCRTKSVLPCQRYKIESNSQQLKRDAHLMEVGFTMSKIQNWKQFTTARCGQLYLLSSVLPCQRYKIESNSQPILLITLSITCRFYHVKDTKLKAIHNIYLWWISFWWVGFTMSKIQNWKQFTTIYLW